MLNRPEYSRHKETNYEKLKPCLDEIIWNNYCVQIYDMESLDFSLHEIILAMKILHLYIWLSVIKLRRQIILFCAYDVQNMASTRDICSSL